MNGMEGENSRSFLLQYGVSGNENNQNAGKQTQVSQTSLTTLLQNTMCFNQLFTGDKSSSTV